MIGVVNNYLMPNIELKIFYYITNLDLFIFFFCLYRIVENLEKKKYIYKFCNHKLNIILKTLKNKYEIHANEKMHRKLTEISEYL